MPIYTQFSILYPNLALFTKEKGWRCGKSFISRRSKCYTNPKTGQKLGFKYEINPKTGRRRKVRVGLNYKEYQKARSKALKKRGQGKKLTSLEQKYIADVDRLATSTRKKKQRALDAKDKRLAAKEGDRFNTAKSYKVQKKARQKRRGKDHLAKDGLLSTKPTLITTSSVSSKIKKLTNELNQEINDDSRKIGFSVKKRPKKDEWTINASVDDKTYKQEITRTGDDEYYWETTINGIVRKRGISNAEDVLVPAELALEKMSSVPANWRKRKKTATYSYPVNHARFAVLYPNLACFSTAPNTNIYGIWWSDRTL